MFLFGLLCHWRLSAEDGWHYKTEGEGGHGRINIKVSNARDSVAAVIKFKRGPNMKGLVDTALEQVSRKEYRRAFGKQPTKVLEFGVAVDKKLSCVKLRTMIRADSSSPWRVESISPVFIGTESNEPTTTTTN